MRSGLAPLRLILPFSLLLLAACGGGGEAPSDPYGLTAEIRGDRAIERTWVEAEVEAITSMSEGEAYTLFNPVGVAASDGDFLSVYDRGNMTLKTFTFDGEYLATYGKGRGRGPGQMMVLADAGVWEDSLVYLVDPRQRRVSFFERDGDFVRVENYERPIYQVDRAADSIKYELPPPPRPEPPFLRIMAPDGERIITRPPVRDVEPIMLDGMLLTTGRRALFVMRYVPVILTYAPEDTTGTAYPTPDWGQDLPTPEEDEQGPPDEINGRTTLSGGVLSVRTSNPADGGIAFDLYDIDAMKYLRSVRMPIEVEPAPYGQAIYAYGEDLVATVRDTMVSLYHVSLPET